MIDAEWFWFMPFDADADADAILYALLSLFFTPF